MSRHGATVTWSRGDEAFTDNKYSRVHEWRFDGGVSVRASSSPQVVRPPLSAEDAVDPEEALIAAAASCHMLWFLSLAARQGFVVDGYTDEAFGVGGRNAAGKPAFTRIVLRPKIDFGGDKVPTAQELESLHHRAHDECFIANSLTAEIVVEQG
jgi:organic hydroperoxide reductase OsmC/OhrA